MFHPHPSADHVTTWNENRVLVRNCFGMSTVNVFRYQKFRRWYLGTVDATVTRWTSVGNRAFDLQFVSLKSVFQTFAVLKSLRCRSENGRFELNLQGIWNVFLGFRCQGRNARWPQTAGALFAHSFPVTAIPSPPKGSLRIRCLACFFVGILIGIAGSRVSTGNLSQSKIFRNPGNSEFVLSWFTF